MYCFSEMILHLPRKDFEVLHPSCIIRTGVSLNASKELTSVLDDSRIKSRTNFVRKIDT